MWLLKRFWEKIDCHVVRDGCDAAENALHVFLFAVFSIFFLGLTITVSYAVFKVSRLQEVSILPASMGLMFAPLLVLGAVAGIAGNAFFFKNLTIALRELRLRIAREKKGIVQQRYTSSDYPMSLFYGIPYQAQEKEENTSLPLERAPSYPKKKSCFARNRPHLRSRLRITRRQRSISAGKHSLLSGRRRQSPRCR